MKKLFLLVILLCLFGCGKKSQSTIPKRWEWTQDRTDYPCFYMESFNMKTHVITRHGGCMIHKCDNQWDHYREVKDE